MTNKSSYEPGRPIWVDLSTPDHDATIAFYGALFGWSAEKGLGAATLTAAFVLGPVLSTLGGSFATVAVNLAYPIEDLLLVMFVVATLALLGWRVTTGSALLLAGFLRFGAADAAYLVQIAHDTYSSGRWVDAVWVLGALSIAAGCGRPITVPVRKARPTAAGRAGIGRARRVGACQRAGPPARAVAAPAARREPAGLRHPHPRLCPDGAGMRCTSAPASASRSALTTPPTPAGCCSAPISRCTARRSPAGVTRSTTRLSPTPRVTGCRPSRSCATRSPATSSSCTTSRS